MQSLFVRVTKETGLAAIIARGVVMRACIRTGVKNPEKMTRLDLQQALPSIKTMLALYMSADEVEERMKALRTLSSSVSGPYIFNLEDPSLDD